MAPHTPGGVEVPYVFIVDPRTFRHCEVTGTLIGGLAATTDAKIVIPSELLAEACANGIHTRKQLIHLWEEDKGTLLEKRLCQNFVNVEHYGAREVEILPFLRSSAYENITKRTSSTFLDAAKEAMRPLLESPNLLKKWVGFCSTNRHGKPPQEALETFCHEFGDRTYKQLCIVLQYTLGCVEEHICEDKPGYAFFNKITLNPQKIEPRSALKAYYHALDAGLINSFSPEAAMLAEQRQKMVETTLAHHTRQCAAARPGVAPRVIVVSDDMEFQNGMMLKLEAEAPGRVMGVNSRELGLLGKELDKHLPDPWFAHIGLDDFLFNLPLPSADQALRALPAERPDHYAHAQSFFSPPDQQRLG